MRLLLFSLSTIFISSYTYGQGCCSGGSCNPVAGGTSVGVLQAKQMEISMSEQYVNSNRFKSGSKDTATLFDYFHSNYLYTRLAYGVTKNLTMSVEWGYYINKTEVGLNRVDTVTAKGIGDLILFPRYDVYNHSTETKKTEITLGLGYKIPLGACNDSTLAYHNPVTGKNIYTTSPPLVQPTTGSQDIILYSFFFRGYPKKNFRIFANALYIKKGWNSLGQKFGDYGSVAIFAGKTFFKKLGVTLQVKGEMVSKMQYDKNIDMIALYNVYPQYTGGKKVFFVPQLSYSFNSFSVFVLGEVPLYQYLNKAQMASQYSFTTGISYRFSTAKKFTPKEGETYYICPMKCEGSASNEQGKCPVCGMQLIQEIPQILPK